MKDWQTLLREKVEQLGRRPVEADLKISRTTLSQVLNNKYLGNLENMERRVINAYSSKTVLCPVLGEIQIQRCEAEQNKPFNISNPTRIRLFKKCKTCTHKVEK